MRAVSLEHPHRLGIEAWQLVVSPGEGQTIDAFESSLRAIVEMLEDPHASVVRPEEMDLQALVLRFSQTIRNAIAANKHDIL